jgi:hypothetical protein
MSRKARILLILGLFLVAVMVAFSFGPIAQDPAYHHFADQRTILGVPNFWNVASNLPFLAVGIWGYLAVERAGSKGAFPDTSEILCWRAFFVGICLVCFGSSYYHLAPANGPLVWDRLPMTIAFMALTAGVIADRIDVGWGVRVALPLLLAVGMGSVAWWAWTESIGQGDLRPYGLVQFFPMLAIPLACWLFPGGRLIGGREIAAMVAFYVAAKLLEHFDPLVMEMLGGVMSGHALKHVAAAGTPAVVAWRFQRLAG